MHMCVCCDCARGSFTFTFYHSFSWCYFSITVLFSFLSLPSSSSLSVLSSPVHTHTHTFFLFLSLAFPITHTLSLSLSEFLQHAPSRTFTRSQERGLKFREKITRFLARPKKSNFEWRGSLSSGSEGFGRARAPFIDGTPPPLKKRSAIFRYVENFPTTKTREIQLLDWPLRRYFFALKFVYKSSIEFLQRY